MAVATTMSAVEFKAYLNTELGDTAASLGWTVDSDYDEVLDDALNLAGETDIDDLATAADVDKIRQLGMLAVWRRVAAWAASHIGWSADGASFKEKEFYDNAKSQVLEFETRTAQWTRQGHIRVRRVDVIHDPYPHRNDEDKPL